MNIIVPMQFSPSATAATTDVVCIFLLCCFQVYYAQSTMLCGIKAHCFWHWALSVLVHLLSTLWSLLVGCLTSQQQASVSQGRICSDNFTCCHTEVEVADPTFYLTQSQYTDTGPTSPSADPITPGAWQGSHWSANFEVTGMTRPRKNPGASGIRTRDLPLSRRTP